MSLPPRGEQDGAAMALMAFIGVFAVPFALGATSMWMLLRRYLR